MVSIVYLLIGATSCAVMLSKANPNALNKQRKINIICLAAFWPLIPLKFALAELKEIVRG